MRRLTANEIEKVKNSGVDLISTVERVLSIRVRYNNKVYFIYQCEESEIDTNPNDYIGYAESLNELKGFLLGALRFQNGSKIINH